MTRCRHIAAALLMAFLPLGLAAQETGPLPDATIEDAAPPRAETGGAQTLEDILRRQQGLPVDDAARRAETGNAEAAPMPTGPLGTLGGASDPDLWRALRFGSADITSQVQGPGATLLVQDTGMRWLQFREGPLAEYGGYFLLGVLALLLVFFLIRGRIRIDGGKSGIKIERFKAIERFGHWLLAGSFILLGITGLYSVYARKYLLPRPDTDTGLATEATIMERQSGAEVETLLLWTKWVHNNVSWAFMIALVMVFVMWVWHNLPSRTDLVWIAKGGGIFTKSHPPAKKFNAGQKLIFWSVIILGASVSASGLSLLFPFDLPMFAKTFGWINVTGVQEWFGYERLPEELTPHAEMQLAQVWHAIIGFAMIGIVLAHIYIGTIGMEGAYDAMGSGEVDLNWAKEHHSIWAEEKLREDGVASTERPQHTSPTPAE